MIKFKTESRLQFLTFDSIQLYINPGDYGILETDNILHAIEGEFFYCGLATDGKLIVTNDGEMVESELGEIPKGWEVDELKKLILFKNGKSKPNGIGEYPVYGRNGMIEYTDKYNYENIIAVGRVGAYCGCLYRIPGKCWISDNAISAKSRDNSNMFCFYVFK